MRVLIAPSGDETGKFCAILSAFPEVWHGSILDVGCRSGGLRQALAGRNVSYIGLDLASPADIVANLEEGLPFHNKTCHVVVALDVLEHLEHFHFGFAEICRVTSQYVILGLPNLYHVTARAAFLLGRQLSGKYGLPPEPPLDRHRWFFSLPEARESVKALAEKESMQILEEIVLIGPRLAKLGGAWATARLPNLLAHFYIVLLKKSSIA